MTSDTHATDAPPHILRATEGDDDIVFANVDDIDLQALAEEIYNLFKRELLLERERQGWRSIE